MLILLRTEGTGSRSVTIVSSGPLLQWHVWVAKHLLDLAGVSRVELCSVKGRRRWPHLRAKAFRAVDAAAIASQLGEKAHGRLVVSSIDRESSKDIGAGAEAWTFQIGSLDGRPPLLREIGRGDVAFTVALRRAGDRLGFALHSGTYQTRITYGRTIDAALSDAAAWPARLLRLQSIGVEPDSTFDPHLAEEPSRAPHPGPGDYVRCALEIGRKLAAVGFEKLFMTTRWNIGIVDAPISIDPPLDSVRWLPAGEGYFVADPMIVGHGDRNEIFCEFYPFRTGIGEIALISANGTTSAPRSVITHERHMSYPFIIEHDGNIYCVPENSRSGELALYKATRYPDEWERVATLIEGVPAIDATIVREGGRWWLFATRGDSDWNTNLFLWHADDLLGPWREHPANPVKTDITAARPAGNLFRIDGDLYRPSQDCSERYGSAVTLNRIVELTPTRFREVAVRRIEPIAPYRHGLHTISSSAERFVIDGRTDFIYWPKPFFVARRILTGR